VNNRSLRQGVTKAVRRFWQSRRAQRAKQGKRTGRRDHGSRAAVTGGAQLDGFIELFAKLVTAAGIGEANVYHKQRSSTYLPGFFRPTKAWDLLVVAGRQLLACIEFKSQVGSFGNNFNNRAEEAIGNAADLWTAYRDGAFEGSPRPWLGYFVLLEEAGGSTSPVRVSEPHFPVFREFLNASYADRYELLCLRLVRERLYDATCFLLSDATKGLAGAHTEPNRELSVARFAASLTAHVAAYAKLT
jgi:hypothetical protein